MSQACRKPMRALFLALNGSLLTSSATWTAEACSGYDAASCELADEVGDMEVSLMQLGADIHSRQASKLTVHDWLHEAHRDGDTAARAASYIAVAAAVGLLLLWLTAIFGKFANQSDDRFPAPAKSAEDAKGPVDAQTEDSVESASEATTAAREAAGRAEAAGGPGLRYVLFFVIGHSIAASSLTVVNKWAMTEFHPTVAPDKAGDSHRVGYVWTLVLIQFVFAAVVTKLAGVLGLIKVEPLQLRTAMTYFPAAGMFMVTIVAGNAVMNFTNVNTFLILRALVPVPCALLETFLYKDPCPPWQSWLGLSFTVIGAGMYSSALGGFEMKSMAWVIIFLLTMPIDGVLIKQSISQTHLSAWGLVYYNNVLASLPLIVYVFVFELPNQEALSDLFHQLAIPEVQWVLFLSSLVGISISFFQLNTRFYISATAFMILGVVNKFLTVLWSEIVFGSSGRKALVGVLMALGGAIFWQISMGLNSVKVRSQSASWEKNRTVPALLVVAALGMAGLVAWNQKVH